MIRKKNKEFLYEKNNQTDGIIAVNGSRPVSDRLPH
jgi:hypothetical protein